MIWLMFLPVLLAQPSWCQNVVISGQNYTRFAVRGTGDLLKSSENWGYFENELEVDLSYQQFRVHLRQRYLMPSEFGVKRTGWEAIDKKYIEFQNSYLTLRGGNFYRQWGRGLFLGMSEVKEINYDSGIEGLYGQFNFQADKYSWEGAIFRGQEIDSTGNAQESASGIMVNWSVGLEPSVTIPVVPYQAKVGLGVIHFDTTSRHWSFDRRCWESEINWDWATLYSAYFLDTPDYYSGDYYHGFYGSIETFGSGWGVLIDYRNYRFPYFSQPALQYPPSGVPEATFTLFDRYPHTPNYSSEVGYQLELNLKQGPYAFKWNFNQISRQERLNLLPSLRDYLLPYWSTNLSLDRKTFYGWRWGLNGGYKTIRQIDERYGGAGMVEWRGGNRFSWGGELQYLWNIEKRIGRRFRDVYLTAYSTLSEVGTLTLIAERSGDIWDVSGTKVKNKALQKILSRESYWPSVEFIFRAIPKTQLQLFYGYERGGLKCSGGLCRLVNPFKGTKLTLTVQF